MDDNKTILIVDDTPANVSLLNSILKPLYNTKVATNGEKALQIAQANPAPDLILLDIMMPILDGYSVCRQLQASAKTKKIPILFVTALDFAVDEAKGLNLGAVDYITKPFSPPVVLARVKTHLELSESREKLSDMLQKTLVGSVKVLTDLLSVSNPVAFSRGLRLKTMVKQLTQRLGIKDSWKYEMAASLSQIGCLYIDADIMSKVHSGQILSEEELEQYRTYPERSYELLCNIPHMKETAEIIRELKLYEEAKLFHYEGDEYIGRALLQGVVHFDEKMKIGIPAQTIISDMQGHFPEKLIRTIEEVKQEEVENRPSDGVSLQDLREAMILAEDLMSENGSVLLPRGTTLTKVIINRLRQNWSDQIIGAIKVIENSDKRMEKAITQYQNISEHDQN